MRLIKNISHEEEQELIVNFFTEKYMRRAQREMKFNQENPDDPENSNMILIGLDLENISFTTCELVLNKLHQFGYKARKVCESNESIKTTYYLSW